MKKPLPEKICVVCKRSFSWRKKWERVWDEVKYCSKRCRGERSQASEEPVEERTLTPADLDRVIRMAWEDRTPFDAIEAQFGLNESETIALMRRELPPKRFAAWRERVHENGKLKDRKSRGFRLGAFKSRMQRMDGSIKE